MPGVDVEEASPDPIPYFLVKLNEKWVSLSLFGFLLVAVKIAILQWAAFE